MGDEQVQKKSRGFAAMDPAKRRAIAQAGGRKAHELGKAPRWTREEALKMAQRGGKKVAADQEHMRAIGRKGGATVARDVKHMAAIGSKGGTKVSANRAHMAELGRKGGKAKAEAERAERGA